MYEKILLSVLIVVLGIGCTTIPNPFMFAGAGSEEPNQVLPELSPEELDRMQHMKLYNPKDMAAIEHEIIGTLEGLSCQKNYFSTKVVTQDEAVNALKIHAVKMGAHGITNVVCESSDGTDWSNNCWESITCIGDAFKFRNEEDRSIVKPSQGI
jgi:uncharacterized protein YbjQ (UPF0145 family)